MYNFTQYYIGLETNSCKQQPYLLYSTDIVALKNRKTFALNGQDQSSIQISD